MTKLDKSKHAEQANNNLLVSVEIYEMMDGSVNTTYTARKYDPALFLMDDRGETVSETVKTNSKREAYPRRHMAQVKKFIVGLGVKPEIVSLH